MPQLHKNRDHHLSFETKKVADADKKEGEPKHKVLAWLWKGFRGLCFSLGLLTIVYLIASVFLITNFTKQAAPPILPSEMVLYLPLDGEIIEQPGKVDLFDPFAPPAPTLRSLVHAIDAAAQDDRVKELYVRLKNPNISLSQIQELRAAISRFKAAGKFTRIYASSYGDGAGGLRNLYLAGVFDERWMQPMGLVTMTGLRIEMPFFRNVLDKIGVSPDFYQREEYKTAYESLTHKTMTKPNRVAMKAVVDALKTAILNDLPADFGMEPEQFEALMDQGLFTAEEALEHGFITESNYADALMDLYEEKYSWERGAYKFVSIGEYAADVERHFKASGKPKVALIYATGAIVDTDSKGNGGVAAADEIAPALFAAAEDKNIEAVILRIDSPGGSPVASETILRAVKKVQQSGKKVIVSMGSVAASGGYWIATGADRIFALPVTLTGSIGVVGGKFSFAGLWDNLGVNWDHSIVWGKNAGMWTINESFTPSQQVQINKMLDRVYSAFLERVADGRGMSLEQADEIARGRVWPGSFAIDKKLVDEMGDLHDAMNFTAMDLGYEDIDDLNVVILPKPLSPIEEILNMLSQHSMVWEGLRMQGQLGRFIAQTQLGQQVESLSSLQDQNILMYEPVQVY